MSRAYIISYYTWVRTVWYYIYQKTQILTKSQSVYTEIGLCKLFVKNRTTFDELATVHECVRAMTTSYI